MTDPTGAGFKGGNLSERDHADIRRWAASHNVDIDAPVPPKPKRVPTHEDVMAAIAYTRIVVDYDGDSAMGIADDLARVYRAWIASLDLGEPESTGGAS